MEQDILIENQRAHAILREVVRDGNITVEQMAKTFDVSPSMVRRDFAFDRLSSALRLARYTDWP